jgi:hypothetical protein
MLRYFRSRLSSPPAESSSSRFALADCLPSQCCSLPPHPNCCPSSPGCCSRIVPAVGSSSAAHFSSGESLAESCPAALAECCHSASEQCCPRLSCCYPAEQCCTLLCPYRVAITEPAPSLLNLLLGYPFNSRGAHLLTLNPFRTKKAAQFKYQHQVYCSMTTYQAIDIVRCMAGLKKDFIFIIITHHFYSFTIHTTQSKIRQSFLFVF